MATKKKSSKKPKVSEAQIFTKLEKTISKTEIDKLADLSIFQESDGSYLLFNKYSIVKTKDGYTVKQNHLIDGDVSFYVLKHAVTWCTYDKRNRIMDSNRIVHLDRELTSLDSAIAIHQNLAKKSKELDSKLIYLAKLGEEKVRRNRIQQELQSYVLESKFWQIRRFNAKP